MGDRTKHQQQNQQRAPGNGNAPKNGGSTIASLFSRFARATSRIAGRPVSFALAALLIIGWAMSGPAFGYSEGWQLFVNTTTTIVTFLMVFLMQSTQNRDTEALQLKIDELIRAVDAADDKVMALDEAEEEELVAVRAKYLALANAGDTTAAAAAADAADAAAVNTAVTAEVTVRPPKSPRPGGRGPRP